MNREDLNTSIIGSVFNKTTATYKFYWFISLMEIHVKEGRTEMSFWHIIARMIANVWYPVFYFRLSLGKLDSLYSVTTEIQKLTGIPIDADKEFIYNTVIAQLDNKEVYKQLKVLSKNVPYWFMTPWLKVQNAKEVEEISRTFTNDCLYAIYETDIVLNPDWVPFLEKNYRMLLDYAYWNLANFIQQRNPNVPNIISKLVKPIERGNLAEHRKFWNAYLSEQGNFHCIYTDSLLRKGSYDLNHFIPWSFVAQDYMWDLLPIDSGINSSKSNTRAKISCIIIKSKMCIERTGSVL